MSNTIYKNDLVESGVIVNKYVAPKATLLTLAVRNARTTNYPKFVFFGDMAKEVAEKYKEKDHVTIYGNVQSSKRDIEGKAIYTQSLFAEKIEETPKLMESFGEDIGKQYAENKNLVEVAGEVSSIFSPSADVVQIIVRTEKNGRFSFVKMFQFSKNSGKTLEDIHKGDNVCVVAEIQTPRKEKDGVINYYENVIVKEIAKV